jgi:hypothetical protein
VSKPARRSDLTDVLLLESPVEFPDRWSIA